MQIYSTYNVKIKNYNKIFRDTVTIYRHAVDYFINVCLNDWIMIDSFNGHSKLTYIEKLIHTTKLNPNPKYNFDKKFYKFPTYLRRAAINEAIGKVSSYKSNLENWEKDTSKNKGKKPGIPKTGRVFPCFYKDNMYTRCDKYSASIKVYVRNTWDWIDVNLKKSDVDYIEHHCKSCKECVPTLVKKGKEWFLSFPFEEKAKLSDINIFEQTILAVDLGLNSAATVSIMKADGTILGRHFLKLPKEYDSLNHSLNRVKKAQQNGNKKTPRLWAKVNGINDYISVQTAKFIMDIAKRYSVDVIVFEHLDLSGKKRGAKKQRLHHWRCKYVISMVTQKAHRIGIRISTVNPKNTSKLAYDGSGVVMRGSNAGLPTYSLCKFKNDKIYNCDLSASYNIGARYFIREILKSFSEKKRLAIEAKVPRLAKRNTCTFATLISLNAGLLSVA